MKMDINKSNIKKLLPIVLFVIVLTLIIGAFTFLRPQNIQERKTVDRYEQDITRIEDVPGVINVKRFSDVAKKLTNRTIGSNRSNSRSSPRANISLPYPRISINYVMKRAYSIKNGTAGENNTFIVVTLDIKNYGYEYFDAHPKKFKLIYRGMELSPIVTVSTGNMLGEVLPNSSRTKGDIIFLLEKKKTVSGVPKITYTDSGYTILYNRE